MSEDEREIRAVHRQWWESNVGLDVERMRECFAPEYLMWNLNGHPYYSLEEKVHLFEYYKQHLVPTECLGSRRRRQRGGRGNRISGARFYALGPASQQ